MTICSDARMAEHRQQLDVHVVGPGFGESQILLLPSGHCMVVDVCTEGAANLTVDLLRQLDVSCVDLLVVTHPDLDHMRGLPELVAMYPPKRVWRFPFGGLRELVSGWCRLDPNDRRLSDVNAAFDVLEQLEDRNVAWEAGLTTVAWCPDPTIEVRCLAPTSSDLRYARNQLFELVEYATTTSFRERAYDHPELGRRIKDYLLGDGALDDHPNMLSLAIAVCWKGRRLLLGGDVENGRSGCPHSGWKGILQQLDEDGLLDRVTELDYVKVAHHGSNGAFHAPAWAIHRRADGTTVATITPFNRGMPLPHSDVLASLRRYAGRLGITENARDAFAQAEAAGWVRERDAPMWGLEPRVSVRLREAGVVELESGTRGAFFREKRHPYLEALLDDL